MTDDDAERYHGYHIVGFALESEKCFLFSLERIKHRLSNMHLMIQSSTWKVALFFALTMSILIVRNVDAWAWSKTTKVPPSKMESRANETPYSSLLQEVETYSSTSSSSRRQFFVTTISSASAFWTIQKQPAHAKADCYADCFQNCKSIAPKNLDYCKHSCLEYCDQPDRQDGLSGSVSAAQGEVGILGGTFGQGTVVKGEDKPPVIQLPGLDFNSQAGRKLIGY